MGGVYGQIGRGDNLGGGTIWEGLASVDSRLAVLLLLSQKPCCNKALYYPSCCLITGVEPLRNIGDGLVESVLVAVDEGIDECLVGGQPKAVDYPAVQDDVVGILDGGFHC